MFTNIILIYSVLIWIISPNINCMTCDDVMDLPPNSKITLQDLGKMSPKHIVECLPRLGSEAIKTTEADYIWQTIIEYYDGVSSIPDSILSQLNWITAAVRPEDYSNISISSIEIVQNFGFDYGFDLKLLEVIADRVREDFAGKRPEDYTYYDLKALNKILCAFNRSEIERIHASAYKEAAAIIGKMNDCNPEVMRGFATLAEDKNAFGPSKDWTGIVLKTVGAVTDYLPGGITEEQEAKKQAEKEKVEEFENPMGELRSTA